MDEQKIKDQIEMCDDFRVFLEITSSSKESIQVLIDKLEEAKCYFGS